MTATKRKMKMMSDRTVPGTAKGILLVVSGASGTGKSTVDNMLISEHQGEFAFSVSATSRRPRPGEENGKDYWFVTREDFEKKISHGEMLEYTEYCGNYYGTPKSELEKLKSGQNLILEIEIQGASNIKRIIPECVTVFVLPPDSETLRARLESRGTNSREEIERRLARAVDEIAFASDYDYLVVNPDGCVNEAVDTIYNIVLCHRHSSKICGDELKNLFHKNEKDE